VRHGWHRVCGWKHSPSEKRSQSKTVEVEIVRRKGRTLMFQGRQVQRNNWLQPGLASTAD
jgi:hypothetical protein